MARIKKSTTKPTKKTEEIKEEEIIETAVKEEVTEITNDEIATDAIEETPDVIDNDIKEESEVIETPTTIETAEDSKHYLNETEKENVKKVIEATVKNKTNKNKCIFGYTWNGMSFDD